MSEGLTPCYSLGNETNPTRWDGITRKNGKYACNYKVDNNEWNNISCDFTAQGYRLAMDAEWEYAARGGIYIDGYKEYSGSSNINEVAWYDGNSEKRTHIIKGKLPNELGLFDMSGNVIEWCWDYNDFVNHEVYRSTNAGCFLSDNIGCSITVSSQNVPYKRSCTIGFRVVRSAQ